MTDYGTFTVQTEKLRAAAQIWADCATDTQKVKDDLAPAVNEGDKFGLLAGSSGVSTSYNNWISDMYAAAQTAERCFRYLDAALVSTANGYDGVDSTTATDFATLDRMI